MEKVLHLSLGDVIALHRRAMIYTGGESQPLLSVAQLEAALMRPLMAAHYEDANLIHQAALLTSGIVQAHAFLDGNKRTAALACTVFLRMNGLHFAGEPLDFGREIERLMTDKPDGVTEAMGRFETWLRSHVEAVSEADSKTG